MRQLFIAIALVGSGALAGCVRTLDLKPAAGAQVLRDRPTLAAANEAGVELVVDGTARGAPEVSGGPTPLKVTIINHGTVPLRIRYDAFSVGAANGFHRYALTPGQAAAQAVAAAPPLVAGYDSGGFEIGPWPPAFDTGPRPWGGPFAFGGWYPGPYDVWSPAPTRDIVIEAIPEGVVAPGGHVTGYLYFSGLDRQGPQVNFQADLVDARTNAPFAVVQIPFVVTRRGKPIRPRA